jgi:iron(III) transport system substrate-binding protein
MMVPGIRSVLATVSVFALSTAAVAQDCCPKELVDAANKEGNIVLYSAVVLDNEQILAKAFSERFPGVKVDIVRAPGARLFTRIETEAAGNQLKADVLDLSDRLLAVRIKHLLADYAPPNAAAWNASSMPLPNVWPRTLFVYGIAYNTAMRKPPKPTWKELEDPAAKGKFGVIIAGSGGSAWALAMFQRKVMGEGNWKALAAQNPRLFESNGPMSSAVIRGEIEMATLLVATANALKLQGAPIDIVYPTEGLPAAPGAAAVFKDAPHPNAARLFLNWSLSQEGQNVIVEKLGGMSLLKTAKKPAGAPDDAKVWVPDNDEFDRLRDPWVKEWDTVFGYRN